jgi:sugar lactone lactonase YvrE
MSITLTKPLVVPEYKKALVKLYTPDPVTSAPVPDPPYTIDIQNVLTALIPGRTARPNACALNRNDLFIANSSPDSQCIFKIPNYLKQPVLGITQAFVFTLDSNDYVGMVFDASGNLYAAEGDPLDNYIVKYTGTDVAYPGTALAAGDNRGDRMILGNAGMTSYFANLSFDAAGNLWASDYKNHRLVVFDAANLGSTNTFHVLANWDGSIPVANNDAKLKENASHLFAEPEGIDFDAAGNLWVANNNDGNAGGVQNPRTSLVQITSGLQATVLATAAGIALTPKPRDFPGDFPDVRSNRDYFIYQVPNLTNDVGARPQFGGLQVDRAAGRIFVSEEIAGNGRGYDITAIAAIGISTAANDLNIITTNPGNGGIALVNTPFP